jgi:hypothetical protein
MKVNEEKLLTTNVTNSLVLSCLINRREVKQLTYNSILRNICLLHNVSFEPGNSKNNNAEILMKIIELIKVYDISLEIVIRLHDYTIIQFINYNK